MGSPLPIEIEEVAPLSPTSATTANTNITTLSQPSTKRTIARSTSYVFFTFQLIVVIIIAIAFTFRYTIHESSSTTLAGGNNNVTQEPQSIIHKIISTTRYNNETANEAEADEDGVVSVIGGSWKYDANDTQAPYNFTQQMCLSSYIDKGDCTKSEYCRKDLMNWRYLDKYLYPYPKFDVAGFREKMKNKRIVFVGSSLVRQQVQALVWTLGHTNVKWDKVKPKIANCTATRYCFTDVQDHITICYQFMGSMATQIYHEGNYTLDHSQRGQGDSSCLLGDNMISEGLARFDLVFVQNIAWYTNLGKLLDSPKSPSEWVAEMTPIVYYDAMKELLTKISKQTKTVVTLGQTGTACKGKTNPESFRIQDIPDNFGWRISDKLWNASLRLIEDEQELSSVQIVDAREPLMQSVHAHPQQTLDNPLQPDCVHFCMDSAAINIYLDMYWNEVFSRY